MKHLFCLLTTAVCLVALPGSGLAEKDAGIPPMLETQRPLSIPAAQPEPRAPRVDNPKPVAQATKGTKTKKAQRKVGKRKTNVASKKKATKTVKKKGASAKHRSKVAASH
jgi:hypothetical protein